MLNATVTQLLPPHYLQQVLACNTKAEINYFSKRLKGMSYLLLTYYMALPLVLYQKIKLAVYFLNACNRRKITERLGTVLLEKKLVILRF